MVFAVLCVLAALAHINHAARRDYSRFTVLDADVREPWQVDLVKLMELNREVEIYEPPAAPTDHLQLLVDRLKLQQVSTTLRAARIHAIIQEINLQSFYDKEFARLDERTVYNGSDFNNFDQIQLELSRLLRVCPVDLHCSSYSIGTTVQGRDIIVFQVGHPDAVRKIWLDSLIHAREWVAGTSVMKTLSHLIDNYIADTTAHDLLNSYMFYVLPVMNPDGFVYSWTTDRLWRKNRNLNEGSSCVGTDLNRNFDIQWGDRRGSHPHPCSQIYRGASAASELETIAVQDQLLMLNTPLISADVSHVTTAYSADTSNTTQDPRTNAMYDNSNDIRSNSIGITVSDADTSTSGGVYQTTGDTLFTSESPARPTQPPYTGSVMLALHVHTVVPAWLYPSMYRNEQGDCVIAKDHTHLDRVARAAVDAIQTVSGEKRWRYGNACRVLYAVNGGLNDYSYDTAGIKYSYTPELKGPGFNPGAEVIEPAFQEFYAALVASIREIENIEGY